MRGPFETRNPTTGGTMVGLDKTTAIQGMGGMRGEWLIEIHYAPGLDAPKGSALSRNVLSQPVLATVRGPEPLGFLL